jgi:hypothetical protein
MVHYKHQLGFVVLSTLTACSAVSEEKYSGRDGKAEAGSDFEAGKPLTIYSRVENGFAMGWSSPGLPFCSPQEFNGYSESKVFYVMSESAFQEGQARTIQNDRLALSALRFASDYNSTAFRLRRAEIEKICPNAGARYKDTTWFRTRKMTQ